LRKRIEYHAQRNIVRSSSLAAHAPGTTLATRATAALADDVRDAAPARDAMLTL
jgi:hypothetical protein